MNEVYKKNLQALKKMNNELAEKVDNLKVTKNDFVIEATKNENDYTIKLSINGNTKYVHSLYRAREQAVNEIDKLGLEHYNLIGVAGIGCGHYIRELLNQFNLESQLIIIENRIDILKEVMKKQDITDILKVRNVQIFDGSSEKYISRMRRWLRRIDYNALSAGNVDFFKTPVLKEKYNNDYDNFVNEFFSVLNYVVNSLGNDPGDTLIGIQHGFENVEYLLKNSFDFSKLEYYKGKPAICVASGPSLDKNIDVLKENQHNALILAAGTSLHKLLNYGIKPDIFSVLERPEKVYKYTIKDLVEEEKFPEDMVAILNGVVHPKIYNNINSDIIPIFRNNVHTENWFVENIDNLLGFDTGLSVANMTFNIAKLLGCSPIIMVGQDLSFSPEGRKHSKDTKYDELGEVEVKEHEIIELDGYDGGKVKSKKLWKQFKNWFEYVIEEEKIKCIDATEGGGYIKGTEIMFLKQVAEKYLNNEVDAFYNYINYDSNEKVKEKKLKFKDVTQRKIEKFKEIEQEIEEILDSISDSKEAFINTKEHRKFAKDKFVEINTKIAQMSNKDKSFFFICQAPFVQLERYKVKMGNLMVNTEEKFINFCNYYLDMVGAIKDIAQKTVDYYEMGIKELDNLNIKKE